LDPVTVAAGPRSAGNRARPVRGSSHSPPGSSAEPPSPAPQLPSSPAASADSFCLLERPSSVRETSVSLRPTSPLRAGHPRTDPRETSLGDSRRSRTAPARTSVSCCSEPLATLQREKVNGRFSGFFAPSRRRSVARCTGRLPPPATPAARQRPGARSSLLEDILAGSTSFAGLTRRPLFGVRAVNARR
jgi:hypothetical protein